MDEQPLNIQFDLLDDETLAQLLRLLESLDDPVPASAPSHVERAS